MNISDADLIEKARFILRYYHRELSGASLEFLENLLEPPVTTHLMFHQRERIMQLCLMHQITL